MKPLAALIRKECAEDILTPWSALFFLFASVLMTVFAILLIGNTELSLLDNAHAVYWLTVIVTTFGCLVAVIQGSDGFAGERDRGTLEALLLAPTGGRHLALAKWISILFSWLILLALSVPYVWAVASTGQNMGPAISMLAVTGTLLVGGFGALALLLSIRIKTTKSVLLVALTVFLAMASPAVLGASLRQSAVARIVDTIDPFMDALNTMDSVVIDSEGLSHQALRLGVMMLFDLLVLWRLGAASRSVDL